MKRYGALSVLAVAQFLMVLDQSVMNVSISQLVEDFDTDVTVIQGVITVYSLVMAALMVTGGKVGDLIGRRRAFAIGMVVYGCGSALTAVSWSVGALLLGWSILEGVGAALVLPALAALIAGNYEGRDRVFAYAVIGGVAGAGIAVGPILGGWVTTTLTWRVVFVGEVVLALAILAALRLLTDTESLDRRPQLDWVGSVLSAVSLSLMVLGILSASTWGWLEPRNSPVEPFGFSLTPFVVGAGALLLWAFRAWQRHREAVGRDPLVRFALFRIASLRSGLSSFLAQNLVLMGIFFVLPLYLQLVLGLDALDTGIRMLPVSVMMFIVALAGSRLSTRFAPRGLVRAGFVVLVVGVFGLIGTIEPELRGLAFGIAMGLIGVGMGLLASQLGNVVQSSVGARDRSEAGGLQYTAQQLGSAVGVALIGAVVLSGLAQNFVKLIADDERISEQLSEEVSTDVSKGVAFVSSKEVEVAVADAGYDDETATALVENYEEAQITALKAGLFLVGLIAAASLAATRGLPTEVPTDEDDETAGDGPIAEPRGSPSGERDRAAGVGGEPLDG